MKPYKSHEVTFGGITIGGDAGCVVQSMTNTSTADSESSVAQILRLEAAGCRVVRLTAQGRVEGENLRDIKARLDAQGSKVALVADIHFTPEVAKIAANYVDKVRINPGNFSLEGGHLEELVEICRTRGVALRIGVNHGSLASHIVEQYGDTPDGMVASAMEFLLRLRELNFHNIIVSMKSSNTRVMVHAYRALVRRLQGEDMSYPIHLGVTEAGAALEGRVKSAVGIGALMSEGIGDTIRVSLTEDPVAEIPVANRLVELFDGREDRFERGETPTRYERRCNEATPIIHSEIGDYPEHTYQVVESTSDNPTDELRSAIEQLAVSQPVVVKRRYESADEVEVAIAAAADFGALMIDGVADGVWVDAPNLDAEVVKQIELMILQASRVRQSHTEYIACPGCGRTLYNIEEALRQIKARTLHLAHLKIGVMGCIVNGPGEMADADYGYVGSGRGKITLYRAGKVVERNIDQEVAVERLIEQIKACGDWIEPNAAMTGDRNE